MPIAVGRPVVDAAAVRKRKTHHKSRQGCSNCKLRRVKCDEAKPKCRKCLDYGVDCTYNTKSPTSDLQMSVAGTFNFDVLQDVITVSPSSETTQLAMFNTNLADACSDGPLPAYQMSLIDLDTLKRFQTRTVQTIGTASTYYIFEREVSRMASANTFLMHILLTLTLMHDRYIAKDHKPSVSEAFHWYQGTALFSQKLKQPILDHERDAIWAAASLIGAVAFSGTDVTSPEEAWPLRAPSCQDLDWLFMCDGKKEIARLAHPIGPSSVFWLASQQGYIGLAHRSPILETSFSNLPAGFIDLYELDDISKRSINPYLATAAALNGLMAKECNHSTIINFFSFVGHVPPEFRTLLLEKDPRALLLLAYWYAKICEYKQWWVYKRSSVECQSICIYLARYHWQGFRITKHLKYPASMCGLAGSDKMKYKNYIFAE